MHSPQIEIYSSYGVNLKFLETLKIYAFVNWDSKKNKWLDYMIKYTEWILSLED